MKLLSILLLSAAGAACTACATATAGLSKNDGRTIVRSVNDASAARVIRARMLRAPEYDLKGVNVEAGQGVVLLKGNVPTQADRIEAERIAWSAPNIDQVGNEIFIDGRKNIIVGTKDSVLNTAVRTRLTADKYVKGTNVNVETYDGIVYLLGVARTPRELDRIARIASETSGAREVVSYLRLADNYQEPNVNYASAPSPPAQTYNPAQQTLEAPTSLSKPAPSYSPSHDLGQSAENEPYYVDPQTGERIILPPGTRTVPYQPSAENQSSGAAPFYIDPDTGQQIKVVYKITRPVR